MQIKEVKNKTESTEVKMKFSLLVESQKRLRMDVLKELHQNCMSSEEEPPPLLNNIVDNYKNIAKHLEELVSENEERPSIECYLTIFLKRSVNVTMKWHGWIRKWILLNIVSNHLHLIKTCSGNRICTYMLTYHDREKRIV